jgi:hypothetical protein
MKQIARSILIILLVFSPYLLAPLMAPVSALYYLYYLAFIFLIIGIMIFNCLIGRFAWSKPYFMSRYNFLVAMVRHQQEFDLPKKLLFEKLMEAIPVIGFEITHNDEKNGNIFATKPIGTSLGENIYISLTEVKDKAMLDFCSVCNFNTNSEERNERNYKDLLNEFEKSLVI